MCDIMHCNPKAILSNYMSLSHAIAGAFCGVTPNIVSRRKLEYVDGLIRPNSEKKIAIRMQSCRMRIKVR